MGKADDSMSKEYQEAAFMENYKGTIKLFCTMSSVFNRVGYLVKLSKSEEAVATFKESVNVLLNVPNSIFELCFDNNDGKYQRKLYFDKKELLETYNQENKDKNSEYKLIKEKAPNRGNSNKILKNLSMVDKEYNLQQIQRNLEQRINKYSAGVQTYQLLNGEIKRVRDKNNTFFIVVEEENHTDQEQKLAQEKTIEKIRFLATRNQYKLSLKNQNMPRPVQNLIMVSIILLITYIGLTIMMNYISQNSISTLKEITRMPWSQGVYSYYLYDGLYLANYLALIQKGEITDFEGNNANSEAELREEIRNRVGQMLELTRDINYLSNQFPNVMEVYISNQDLELVMYKPDQLYLKTYTYIEAMYLFTSTLLDVSTTELLDINAANLRFLRENLLNSFHKKDGELQKELYKQLQFFAKSRKSLSIIIMVASAYLYLIACILIYPFLLKAHRSQKEVLSFFLRIPTSTIIKLQSKCESYLIDNENIIAEDKRAFRQEKTEDTEDSSVKFGQKQKTFFQVTSAEWGFFWNVLIVMIILDAYSIIVSVYVMYMINYASAVVNSIEASSSLDPIPMFIMTAFQSYIIQKKFPNSNLGGLAQDSEVKENPWTLDSIAEVISFTTVAAEKVLKVNLLRSYMYKSKYANYFYTWMHSSLCVDWELFEYFTTKEDCSSFLSGIAEQGFYNLIMEYVFVLDIFLNQHIDSLPNDSYELAEWKIMWPISRHIIPKKNTKYMDYVMNSVKDLTDKANMYILLIALMFMLLLILCFLVFWLPYTMQLKKEICRTNLMLLLIPIEVYLSNKYMKKSFEDKVSTIGIR